MNHAALLTTKLTRPPARANLVPRADLSRLLEQAGEMPLTLVCAPAGYGKTTLMAGWLAGQPVAGGWLSLDEGDNDPSRFWTYAIAALRSAAPTLGEQTLALLASLQPLFPAITFLINELAALPRPLFLVIDDYHFITNQAVHESITYFLDHMPASVHLILACRADPPLPLARLRVRGQLLEIREKELRFTPAETARFMQQVMGLSLTAAQLQALDDRAEGWIAGLQLAGLAAAGAANPAEALRAFSGSHRHLVDYLTEEVLARQPASVRDFLLLTALLDRFCAPLCAAILPAAPLHGQEEAEPSVTDPQSLLELLDRANLFLVPLDNDRRWYRYHHLFADLLRLQARRALDGPALRRIHQSAAGWFREQQLWSEAIHHALAAGDVPMAGELVAGQAAAAIARGELESLKEWLAALPDDQIQASPRLSLAQAWADLFQNQLEGAEARLRPILETPGLAATVDDALLGEALAIRATLAFARMDYPRTIADTERALALLPESQMPLRTMISWHLAFIYRSQGETRRGLALYHAVIELSARGGNILINVSARRELADLLIGQGELPAARAILRRLLADATAGDWLYLWPIAGAHLHLGEIAYEWNDLEEADAHLRATLFHPEAAQIGFDASAQALLAQIHAARGDRTAALESIQLAQQGALRTTHPQRRTLTLAQICRFRLAQGDLARAAAALPDGRDVPADPRHEVYARMMIAHAHYRLASGEPEQAARLVADLLPAAETAGRVRDQVELHLLQAALSAGAEADAAATAAALAAIGRALALAEPAALLRLFLDAGPVVAGLLQQLADLPEGRTPYLTRVLSALDRPSTIPPANRLLIEPLSERELEVLHLMAAGFSNRGIADRLVFTVATAKKHAEHIYGKLGVSSRTQAIARARELNLLP